MRLKAFEKLKPQFLYNRVKNCNQDFPVGTVGRSPPDNVGDMGLTPGPGRFYMLPEQLSPQAAMKNLQAKILNSNNNLASFH